MSSDPARDSHAIAFCFMVIYMLQFESEERQLTENRTDKVLIYRAHTHIVFSIMSSVGPVLSGLLP